MKNNLLKLYFLIFFLACDFYAFAQPGTDNPDGDLEGEDPQAPINSKLVYLALIGIAFAFFYFIRKREEKISE
jgi:hypothetical protein